MTGLVRNHLVWIADAAWEEVSARLPDGQAREIVDHWRSQELPLVVTSQPAGIGAGRAALGLPAPHRWCRRRLAFDVAFDAVHRHGHFPTLRQASRHYRWQGAALRLDHALAALGAQTHVYGSHGWQLLTGQSYLHDGSDIDLCIDVPNFETARAAVTHLERAALDHRVDGELVFPDGSAVAWREFRRMLAGETGAVLIKRLDGPRLAAAGRLRDGLRSGTSTSTDGRQPVAATAVCHASGR